MAAPKKKNSPNPPAKGLTKHNPSTPTARRTKPGQRIRTAGKKLVKQVLKRQQTCVSAALLKGIPPGSKGATRRHIAFALEMFTHGDLTEAYRNVYDPEETRSATVVSSSASRTWRHPTVVAEIARLKELHADELKAREAEAQKEHEAAIQRGIATRDEVLMFHTAVMRASSSSFSKEGRDLISITEKKVLAPPKYDKDGEPIENPDADEDGYITMVERTPPTLKDRQAAAAELAKLQGYVKASERDKTIADPLLDLLTELRGGGRT